MKSAQAAPTGNGWRFAPPPREPGAAFPAS